MAEKPADGGDAAPTSKSRWKPVIAIVAGIALLALGAGAGFAGAKWMAPKDDDFAGLIVPPVAHGQHGDEEAKKQDKAAEEEDCIPEKETAEGKDKEHGAKASGHGGEAPKGDAGKSPEGKPPCGKKKKKVTVLPEFATTYYDFPGNFTANLRNSRHFLQVQIAVSTQYDEQVIANVKAHEPAIRGAVIATLSDSTDDDIVGVEAKARLAERVRDAINAVLENKTRFGGVEDVHFTSFVTQ